MNLYDLFKGAKSKIIANFVKLHFGSFGKGSSFDPVSSFFSYENIYIGDNVYIGPNARLSADNVKIKIGDDTIIGPGLHIMAGDHPFDKPGLFYHNSPKGINKDVTIGRNVWMGVRVTILKGVQIGDSAIVGAGSIVTKNVPSFSIVAGNPAKFIRWRFSKEDMKIHKDKVLKRLKEL